MKAWAEPYYEHSPILLEGHAGIGDEPTLCAVSWKLFHKVGWNIGIEFLVGYGQGTGVSIRIILPWLLNICLDVFLFKNLEPRSLGFSICDGIVYLYLWAKGFEWPQRWRVFIWYLPWRRRRWRSTT